MQTDFLKPHIFYPDSCAASLVRVLNRFFGTRDFPHLKLGMRGLKAKSGGVSGLKYAWEVGCQI